MNKSERWECLFCLRFSICVRENNPIIKEAIKKTSKCPDRRPIWINPSERVPFHEYENPVQIIGEPEFIDINPYFIKPKAFTKSYLAKRLKEMKKRLIKYDL